MNDVQVGITSFIATNQTIDYCDADDVFTRVSGYADWIKQNMALDPNDNEETNKPPIFWWPF